MTVLLDAIRLERKHVLLRAKNYYIRYIQEILATYGELYYLVNAIEDTYKTKIYLCIQLCDNLPNDSIRLAQSVPLLQQSVDSMQQQQVIEHETNVDKKIIYPSEKFNQRK